jgi:hypothetical protein
MEINQLKNIKLKVTGHKLRSEVARGVKAKKA